MHAQCSRQIEEGGERERGRGGGGGGEGAQHGLQIQAPYLGSLQPILDPLPLHPPLQRRESESRVWLEKILYAWRRWGRHGAESHSGRSVHREKRGGGCLRPVGRCRSVGFIFFFFFRNNPSWMLNVCACWRVVPFLSCLSPQHLCRSLRIRDVTTL